MIPTTRNNLHYSFRHAEYEEQTHIRAEIKHVLAKLLFHYHAHSPHQYNLLAEIGYRRLFSSIPSTPLPSRYETQVGNLVEILGCELARRNGYEIPALRLHVNPNPDQSMKGDDILGFRFASPQRPENTILIGEAKFTGQFNTDTVKAAVTALEMNSRPSPLSIEFIATLLQMRGEDVKASKVLQLHQKLRARSDDVNLRRFVVLATKNRPKNPFEYLESLQGEVNLSEYAAVNIVFQADFSDWISEVYNYATQHVDKMRSP